MTDRRCPSDHRAARLHHDIVRRDAMHGAPITHHGRHLTATLRPWPGVGLIGECACHTSLLLPDPGEEI